MHRLGLTLAALVVLSAPPSAATERAPQDGRGTLVLEGGGRAATGFAEQVAALLPGDGPLCIITTALDGIDNASELNRFGGQRIPVQVLDIDAESIDDPAMLDRLAHCAGYYFTGGDPEVLSSVWRPSGYPSRALRIVQDRFETRSAVVSGSSAGAMIAGEVTLCECGARSSVIALVEDRWYEADGFGLVEDVLVDAHFFARGLLGRHLRQMINRTLPAGVGVDEATAVVVPGDGGPWTVIGDRGVALIRSVDLGDPGPARFDISLLTPGDRFDPRTGVVSVGPSRTPLADPPAAGAAALNMPDIFARDAVPILLADLARDPADRAIGRAADGLIKLVFEETERTAAYADGHFTTVLNVSLTLDVRD